jgi:hypothetical protein
VGFGVQISPEGVGAPVGAPLPWLQDPWRFCAGVAEEQVELMRQLEEARGRLSGVNVARDIKLLIR